MSLNFAEKALHVNTTATSTGSELVMDGFVYPVIQVTGTFTASMYFEVTLNGQDWSQVLCISTPIAPGEEAGTGTSTTGIFRGTVMVPYHAVRVNVYDYTDGEISVIARAIA